MEDLAGFADLCRRQLPASRSRIGVTSAWLVARTNAYFRQVTILAAYFSLAAPVMVKAIGWILLLGPNKGVINECAAGGIRDRRRSDRAFLARPA